MNCLLKSFILKQINKLLDQYKDNVGKARGTVNIWLSRADSLTNCLKGLSQKLEDSQLTDKELEDTLKEIENLVKSW